MAEETSERTFLPDRMLGWARHAGTLGTWQHFLCLGQLLALCLGY